jgi:signal transduction histidine kinase
MTDTRPALPRVASYAAYIVIAAGLCIVAGWQFRIPLLRGQALGTFVAPNSGLCFACSGISILLQMSLGRKRQYLGFAIAAFVTIFALATAAEYLFRVDLGIDRLFLSHRLSDWTLPLPGRFSVNAVFGFLFAGLGMMTLRKNTGWPWPEICGALVVLVFYLSVIAYLLDASILFNRVMALHTAILFGLLGVAIACGASRPILLGIVLSPFAGAVASRKMVIAVVLILPSFGILQAWAERAGIVSARLGIALTVIASVFVFTILALRNAAVLNETDQKRLDTEAALVRSSQLATAGRMAASIAHEVNNPLEAVTNIIYLLKSDDLPEDVRRKYLDVAEKELSRVSAIARRTLGFYREDAEEVQIDLREMIEGVLAIYRNKLPDSATVGTSIGENPWIVARAGEVRQILMNLLANAIDALPEEDGRLDINVSTTRELATIEIKDNGRGIPRENLAHIFEPFFTTKKEYGTGLGLWVSKELVIKNNGTMRVISSTDATDHGTIFELSFPAVHPATPPSDSLAEAERAG